jgi:N-acyl-D-aspartate/D-glutamate deacylase
MQPHDSAAMVDLVITGGTIVDGSGGPPERGDIGVTDGRIVFVDTGPQPRRQARETIDAAGLTVAPGFIDLHTHYDAQVFWDSNCGPSSLYGVTTVFTGNCGFSIAPLQGDSDYMMRLLARVEGIPLPALQEGVPWGWSTFDDYLNRVGDLGPGVNFGALAGHSAIRRAILGERSGTTELQPGELAAMCELLAECLRGGAIGFSSSWAGTHMDGDGNPVPSRAASAEELLALCRVLADFPGRQVEFIPTNGPYEDEHLELMTAMAVAAKSPLNWNILIPRSASFTEGRLRSTEHAAAQGARVVGLSYPDVIRGRVSFLSSGFDSLPGWAETMTLEPAEKLVALSDPACRDRLRAGALVAQATGMATAFFEGMVVDETFDPSNATARGRVVGDIARDAGKDPFDVLCDIVIADELRTGLVPPASAADDRAWEERIKTWTDDRVVMGASDAGAHLDMLSTFDYPARLLALSRHFAELPLEQAVHQLTEVPARLYGLKERGAVRPGHWADLVLFDAETVDAGPVVWRNDLPAQSGRLYSEPVGIASVLVNGKVTVRDGSAVGEPAGKVLRGGVDTVGRDTP